MNHMKRNKLFNNKQFGFLDGRATALQLLVVLDKWMKIIDGGTIDCINCDFKKVFDKVPHQRLLKKVENYEINREIFGWIGAFLSIRTQQVNTTRKLKGLWHSCQQGGMPSELNLF